ncbi:nucleotide-binding protein [Candidatus Woesearchaeota archaeon]|nr:nucleotide-binding protein [Candidatus Woesearchaeota archaeon]
MKTRIILDTNFLLIPGSLKVDIFSEIDRICDFSYELHVLKESEDELERIMSRQKGKHREAARLAKQLIKAKHLKTLALNQKAGPSKGADQLLLESAARDTIIATQDKALRQSILRKGFRVIMLRQKKYLQLVK